MTKQELLKIMRLLSALEVFGFMKTDTTPGYLLEDLEECVAFLEREILK